MCFCDEYEFTINRADEFMVGKRGTGIVYEIDPEELTNLIGTCLANGILAVAWKSEERDGDVQIILVRCAPPLIREVDPEELEKWGGRARRGKKRPE